MFRDQHVSETLKKKLEEPNPRTRKSEYSRKTETSAHAIYLAGNNQEWNQHYYDTEHHQKTKHVLSSSSCNQMSETCSDGFMETIRFLLSPEYNMDYFSKILK